ncbi:hypothetical protein L3V83_15555 [Thiotrichales bacterium 19X7-9]|nr:hypothetical protein [Thiotrichales bacterium 19X7-9]
MQLDPSKAKELFEMAYDIESDVFDMMEQLEVIQEMLNRLTELHPNSLIE